jgi:hypothetical protein
VFGGGAASRVADGDRPWVASLFRATDAGGALLSFAYTPKRGRLLCDTRGSPHPGAALFVKRFRRSLGGLGNTESAGLKR